MNDSQRIAGWSAVLLGLSVIVAFGLLISTFMAMPAEAMEPANYALRLEVLGGRSPAQRAGVALGFGFQTLAGVLMFPALFGVYASTRKESEAGAVLALGMAALSIPFFLLLQLSGFSFVYLSAGFAGAAEGVQVARAEAQGYAERLSRVYEPIFWLFFTWATALWFGPMRRRFAPWLAWLGLGVGLVGVISTVGGVLVPVLEYVAPMALLVLAVWFIGLGASLLRPGSGVR